MFGLLSWLWDRATRVYYIFGTIYSRVRDAALHAWDWAKSQADRAYSNARYWILYYYDRAKDRIATALSSAYARALWYYNLARDAISDALSTAWRWVQDNAAKLGARISALWEDVKGLVSSSWQTFRSWVEDRVASAIAWAAARAADVLQLAQAGDRILTDRIEQIKTLIRPDDPRAAGIITTLISDPLGFVAAYLQALLVDVLQWALAYGLGTTIYTLPPWPGDDDLHPPTLAGFQRGRSRGTSPELPLPRLGWSGSPGFASVGERLPVSIAPPAPGD